MDPYNWTCANIDASGRNDYMGNPMPLGGNSNSGGSIWAGSGGGINDVNCTYDANGNLTSYNASSPKPSIWQNIFLGLSVAGACVNQYQQGQAAVEQQQTLRAQQLMEYRAFKEQNSMNMAMAQQQLQMQQMQETMKMVLMFAMVQSQMKQMANQDGTA